MFFSEFVIFFEKGLDIIFACDKIAISIQIQNESKELRHGRYH